MRCPARPVTFKSERDDGANTNTIFRRHVVVAVRETWRGWCGYARARYVTNWTRPDPAPARDPL